MFAAMFAAATCLQATALPLVPMPAQVEVRGGSFRIDSKTVVAKGSSAEAAKALRKALAPATGYVLETGPAGSGSISLDLAGSGDPESYTLDVTPEQIRIQAPGEAGLFYGIQTLRQLLPVAVFASTPQAETWSVPCVHIADSPRFKWRGVMLDVARHFTEKPDLLKFIDALALHKINILHLHLTDDQGWRIQINAYPRLTEVGSVRRQTVVGHNTKDYDGIPHTGFYTQAEMREVVAYAAERHITIVPEIDMPGHMVAAIAAYPELGDGQPAEVMQTWGVSPRVLNTSPRTIHFCQTVLSEIASIFPSEFIHVGGDECPKTQWQNDPAEQQRIKERGLKDEHELQSWFMRQMEDYLHLIGRRMIGWDEILEGGLPPRAAVMSWRGTSGGLQAANEGHDVVMTPTSHMYLDYYQGPPSTEPDAIGGFVPLRQTYSFNPLVEGLAPGNERHILGVQGNIWTEYMKTYKQREYMAFPRVCAVAEIGWSPQESRRFPEFLNRVTTHLERLKAMGVAYRAPQPGDSPIASWKPADLVGDWKELTWELTPGFLGQGDYRVTFLYTGGAHRLDIERASLWVDGVKVAEDIHPGTTGGSHKDNRYTFKGVPAGTKVELRATVRPDGGTDSMGDIFFEKF